MIPTGFQLCFTGELDFQFGACGQAGITICPEGRQVSNFRILERIMSYFFNIKDMTYKLYGFCVSWERYRSAAVDKIFKKISSFDTK